MIDIYGHYPEDERSTAAQIKREVRATRRQRPAAAKASADTATEGNPDLKAHEDNQTP